MEQVRLQKCGSLREGGSHSGVDEYDQDDQDDADSSLLGSEAVSLGACFSTLRRTVPSSVHEE